MNVLTVWTIPDDVKMGLKLKPILIYIAYVFRMRSTTNSECFPGTRLTAWSLLWRRRVLCEVGTEFFF